VRSTCLPERDARRDRRIHRGRIKYVGSAISATLYGHNYAGHGSDRRFPGPTRQAVDVGRRRPGRVQLWGAHHRRRRRLPTGSCCFNTPHRQHGLLPGVRAINGTVKGFGETDSTGVTNDTSPLGHGLSNTDRIQVFNVSPSPSRRVDGKAPSTTWCRGHGHLQVTHLRRIRGGHHRQGEFLPERSHRRRSGRRGRSPVAVGALVLTPPDMTGAVVLTLVTTPTTSLGAHGPVTPSPHNHQFHAQHGEVVVVKGQTWAGGQRGRTVGRITRPTPHAPPSTRAASTRGGIIYTCVILPDAQQHDDLHDRLNLRRAFMKGGTLVRGHTRRVPVTVTASSGSGVEQRRRRSQLCANFGRSS